MSIPGFDDTLNSAVVPSAPSTHGGSPTPQQFPGIARPSSDMQAVRDGRRSTLQAYLVDLSTARSIAAGTALQLGIQGNIFMADPLYDLTGVAQAGIARVHFQDVNTNPNAPGTYVTVLPTAVYRVPFTQVLVENYAQAGKFLYIVYGTDVDVVPGGSQQVSATIINQPDVSDRAARLLGIVYGTQGQLMQDVLTNTTRATTDRAALMRDLGVSYAATFNSTTAQGANAPLAIVGAGSNANGLILWSAGFYSRGPVGQIAAVLAKATNPANVGDGDPLVTTSNVMDTAGATVCSGALARPVFVAAGKGLFIIGSGAETSKHVGACYTLL